MLSEKQIEDLIVHYWDTHKGVHWYREAAHAIAERMREGVVFEGKAQLTFLYPSGKCAIFESKEISLEIMDSTSNEEPPSYEWQGRGSYRVYVMREDDDQPK